MGRKFFPFVGGDCVRHIFVCDKKSHNDLCEWFRLFPCPPYHSLRSLHNSWFLKLCQDKDSHLLMELSWFRNAELRIMGIF